MKEAIRIQILENTLCYWISRSDYNSTNSAEENKIAIIMAQSNYCSNIVNSEH